MTANVRKREGAKGRAWEPHLSERLSRYALALANAVVVWLLLVGSAHAQGVAIGGRVVNGTAGGAAPAGQVRVVAVRDGQPLTDRGAQMDASGAFAVADLPAGPGITYVALAEHGGVTYWSEAVTAGAEATIRVYEQADATPVFVERHAIAILSPNAANRGIDVLELLVLRNESDRTWVPRPDGPGGPMGLLRFSLPDGATDLRAVGTLGREEIFTVDRGFATTMPVLPGRQEVSFAYRIAYGTGEYVFTKTLPYPTEELALQAPEEVLGTVIGLSDAGQVGVERRFKQFRATGLAPRAQVVVHLRDLPGAPPNVLASPIKWAAAALAGLAAIGAGALAWRRRPDPVATVSLAREIATLDVARERGQIDDMTHRAERDALQETYLRGTT